jgi:Zn-dependent metalloprotease
MFIPPQIVSHILNNAPYEVARKFIGLTDLPVAGADMSSVARNYLGGFSMTGRYSPKSTLAGDGGEGKVARTVYDAESKARLPGRVVREEASEPSSDVIINNAFEYSGNTWDFFFNSFKRDSIDNKGFHLRSTVHFSKNYPNAFWNGTNLVFGDGDGEIFKTFMLLDISAHEISHGLTEHTAGLEYYSQSGALNEHYSDVFGSLVKQFVRNESADKANWIIGEGLFTEKINGVGIRLMSAPGAAFDDAIIGRDKQTSHMKDYNHSPEDNQCVHINSGIPNKAFYEFSKNIGGNAWLLPGKVWYETLLTKLNSKSTFQNMTDATQEVVIKNYGTGIALKALKEAWASVGLKPRHHVFKQFSL